VICQKYLKSSLVVVAATETNVAMWSNKCLKQFMKRLMNPNVIQPMKTNAKQLIKQVTKLNMKINVVRSMKLNVKQGMKRSMSSNALLITSQNAA